MGAAVLAILAATAHGSENDTVIDGRLDDVAITTAVVGKTYLGTYQDGERWRETYFIDEGLDYQDRSDRSRGTWYAEDDLLCTFYDDDELNGGCFAMIRRSANCHDFYAVDDVTKLPWATHEAMRAGYDWTARGWRSDQPSSCPKGLVS
jgi:hypothetical protein